jgi:hypothetical protein
MEQHMLTPQQAAPLFTTPERAKLLDFLLTAALTREPPLVFGQRFVHAFRDRTIIPATLDAREVAGLLHFHVDTIYEMVAEGRLIGFTASGQPFVRDGKRGRKGLRILETSVQVYIEIATAQATARREAPITPPPAAATLAAPKPKAKAAGSRVVLPYPGRTR